MEPPILLPSNDICVCTNCGASMLIDKEACPWCGTENPQAMNYSTQSHQSQNWSHSNWDLDQIILVDEDTTLTLPEPLVKKQNISHRSSSKSKFAFWLRPFSATLLLTLLIIIGLVSLGIYQGLNDRQVQRKVAAIEAFDEGRALMDQGEYELAIAYFRQAVKLEPNFEAAQKFLEIAELDALVVASDRQAQPTPQPETEQSESNSVTAPPTPNRADHQAPVRGPLLDPPKLFEDGMSALEKGEWQLAAATFDLLTSQAPNHRPAEVANGLFKAQMELGRLALEENELENALRHFDQALAARPDDADALELRSLTSGYYSGQRAYINKDWSTASKHLRTIYLSEPDFLDTVQLLAQSHYELGKQYEKRQVWCQAAQEYRSSLNVLEDRDVANLAEENENRCNVRATEPSAPRFTSTPEPRVATATERVIEEEDLTATPWPTFTPTTVLVAAISPTAIPTVDISPTATDYNPTATAYATPDINATNTAIYYNLTTTPYATANIHATETAYVYDLTATAQAVSSPNITPTQTPFIPSATPIIQPTETFTTVPADTPTVTRVIEAPTNTPANPGFTYMLSNQSISVDGSCSGHYIMGMVRAPDGAPLAGITIQAVDEYGNWKTTVTKDNPLGQYDIPIPSDVTNYQVMIVSGSQQLSPQITIQHTQELSQSSNACHILNWQQTQ